MRQEGVKMSTGDYRFITKIASRLVSVYDYDKYIAEDPERAHHEKLPKSYNYCSGAEVVWGLYIETRDWGIKNITPYIDRVNLSIFDEDENELCLSRVQTDEYVDDDWSVDWEWGSDNREAIIPVTVMVYFEDKRIIVEF